MSKTPLLLYSDAPCGTTGLGRITRDLATQIWQDKDCQDKFELGTYGYGATGSRKFPWIQYSARDVETINPDLGKIWLDFAGNEKGILMPIMPPSWIFGLLHPEYAAKEDPGIQPLCDWLKTKPFQVWSYLAIESCSAGMKFNEATRSTILKSDRVLLYNKFGQKVAENSGIKGLPFIHHGIYCDTFKRNKSSHVIDYIRTSLGCNKDTFLIGCVATNSGRKRLSSLFAAFSYLRNTYEKNCKLWLHTNLLIKDWQIPNLLDDYGLMDDSVGVTISGPSYTDEWLANAYSACDCTILPTYGEGFGYPIAESLSCGTPCVTGSFACEGELATQDCLAKVCTLEVDGINGLMKPSYDHTEFAILLNQIRERPPVAKELSALARTRWDWSQQWIKFKEWLLQ